MTLLHYPYSKVRKKPNFIDVLQSNWNLLYAAKLKACSSKMCDFINPKADQQLKDDKRDCLIELIDILDQVPDLHNEKIL